MFVKFSHKADRMPLLGYCAVIKSSEPLLRGKETHPKMNRMSELEFTLLARGSVKLVRD